jgi:hypothetical protein
MKTSRSILALTLALGFGVAAKAAPCDGGGYTTGKLATSTMHYSVSCSGGAGSSCTRTVWHTHECNRSCDYGALYCACKVVYDANSPTTVYTGTVVSQLTVVPSSQGAPVGDCGVTCTFDSSYFNGESWMNRYYCLNCDVTGVTGVPGTQGGQRACELQSFP